MTWHGQFVDWHMMDTADQWGLVSQLSQAVGTQQLQGHQILQNRDDDEIEMRGSFHGYPARLKIEMSMGSPEWELKGTNPSGRAFDLWFDEDDIPKPAGGFTGDNAAWDDDDEAEDSDVKIFFGRGLSLEADTSEIDALAAVYLALSAELRTSIAQITELDHIYTIDVGEDGKLSLSWHNEIYKMVPDPVVVLSRGVWLLGQLAWGMSQLQPAMIPPPGVPSHQGMFQRAQCPHCSSLFSAGYTQCPNCLAPQHG